MLQLALPPFWWGQVAHLHRPSPVDRSARCPQLESVRFLGENGLGFASDTWKNQSQVVIKELFIWENIEIHCKQTQDWWIWLESCGLIFPQFEVWKAGGPVGLDSQVCSPKIWGGLIYRNFTKMLITPYQTCWLKLKYIINGFFHPQNIDQSIGYRLDHHPFVNFPSFCASSGAIAKKDILVMLPGHHNKNCSQGPRSEKKTSWVRYFEVAKFQSKLLFLSSEPFVIVLHFQTTWGPVKEKSAVVPFFEVLRHWMGVCSALSLPIIGSSHVSLKLWSKHNSIATRCLKYVELGLS